MHVPSFVEVSNASKSFELSGNSVPVFSSLNYEVLPGTFSVLMGPSGSGKTTLLHSIGGLERLTSGTIRVGDDNIGKMNEAELSRWRARSVGYIFQFYNLMPMLTTAGNIELPLTLLKLNGRERKKRVRAAAELANIDHRLGHRPRQMSGGEQQRVAIARAIVSDPPLLLCDEPTGDLDRATADEVLRLLQALSRDHGKTIIMVTHDMAAADYADNVYHFNKGVLSNAEVVA